MVTFLWSRIFSSLYMDLEDGRREQVYCIPQCWYHACQSGPRLTLTDNTIFVMIACLLSTYTFSNACSCDGRRLSHVLTTVKSMYVWNLQPTQYLTPIRSFPEPFKCQVSLRSQEVVALIEVTQTVNEMWGMSCMPVFLQAWTVSLVWYMILELSP